MLPWNVILGGVTGLIGTVTTTIANYKTQKQKNQHELDIKKLDIESMKVEAEMNIKVEKARVEGEVQIADSEAFTKSMEYGNKDLFSDKWVDKLFVTEGWIKYITVPVGVMIAFLFGSVDFLKALMRPGLTLYLMGCSTWITIMAWNILEINGIEALTSVQALAIFTSVIDIIIYLTVSCVTWWFGDRRVAKFLMRMKNPNFKE